MTYHNEERFARKVRKLSYKRQLKFNIRMLSDLTSIVGYVIHQHSNHDSR